jgi:hypothetical protein
MAQAKEPAGMSHFDRLSVRQFGALFDPEQQGFSTDIRTGKSPESGYMVGQAGSETKIPNYFMHPEHLQRYKQANMARLSQRGMYMGGWNDVTTSATDLDVSANLPSGGPMERGAAHVAMIKQGQRSLYNVDTGDVEWNKYYGLSQQQAYSQISADYEAAKERP